MSRIGLAFGVHCHQPVGNFEEVIARAVEGCYLPFLDAALSVPAFKHFVHFSGALLKRVESTHPAVIEHLRTLVGRGQIEILGGGLYEPVLSVLPEPERAGQIKRMSDYLHGLFGVRPKGVWLAEQVWEPQLLKPLVESGITHIFLDDLHVADMGLPADDTHGTFLTEDSGLKLTVFPVSTRLRYLVPYKPVATVLQHLKFAAERHPDSILTYADDGEKFGLWPGTKKWSEGRSLAEFMEELAASEFIRLTTPAEWTSAREPRGLWYIPTTSFREMAEWSLPADMQAEYGKLKYESDRHPAGALRSALLRDGFWKGFFMKYPESNWMHKRVCGAISKIGPVLDKLGGDREAKAMRDLLDRATCNDAYWHGMFGGLYLPPLRRAVYENLLSAENRFWKKMGIFPSVQTEDLDLDGRPEILVNTDVWVLAIKPSLGAGIVEWSHRPAAYNFQNTVTRRPEGYHKGPMIHDRYRKMSGLVYALHPGATSDQFRRQAFREWSAADGPFESSVRDTDTAFGLRFKRETPELFFEKDVVIFKRESKLSIQAALDPKDAKVRAVLGVGLELFYASIKDLAIRIGPTDVGISGVTDSPALDASGRELEITDRSSRTRWLIMADREVQFWMEPSYTVSQTETGFDKTFQGLSLMVVSDSQEEGRRSLTLFVEVSTISG